MTKADTVHFRELLLALNKKLETSLSSEDPAEESAKPNDAIGLVTRVEAIQTHSMNAATRLQQQKRHRQVQYALQALKQGTYGQCVQCEGEIPKGRLEIMPETRLCVECAR